MDEKFYLVCLGCEEEVANVAAGAQHQKPYCAASDTIGFEILSRQVATA